MMRRRCGSVRSGTAILEMALILPPCLLIILAVIDYGRYEMVRQLALHAARSGARLAVNAKRSATTEEIQAVVRQQFAIPAPPGMVVSVYRTNSAGEDVADWTTALVGEPIAVQIDAHFSSLFPTFGILPDPVPVRAKAVMRCELN